MHAYLNYYDIRESKNVTAGKGDVSTDERIFTDSTSEAHYFSDYFDSYTKRMGNANLDEKV
jgi:hypothetical protein